MIDCLVFCISDRLAQNTPRHDSTLSSIGTQPLEIRAESYPINNNNNPDEKFPLPDRNTEPPNTGRTEQSLTRSGEGTNKSVNKHSSLKQGTNSNMDGRIRLDLETEDGKKQQIILDDKGTKLYVFKVFTRYKNLDNLKLNFFH